MYGGGQPAGGAAWAPGSGRRSGGPGMGPSPVQVGFGGAHQQPQQQARSGGQHFQPGVGHGPRGRSNDALNLSAQQLQHLSASGALHQARQPQYGQQVLLQPPTTPK